MRHNSREYAGVSLDIPIFNRRAARNDISKVQLAVRSQQLAVTQTVQAKYEFVFRRRFPISTAASLMICVYPSNTKVDKLSQPTIGRAFL